MTLLARLKARIRESGPITVAEYMEAAVTEYYVMRDPFGRDGDFTTAPEISQIFGELIGAWIADQWHRKGKPRALLLELGPGRGTLMKDMLRATRHVDGFHASLDVYLVETSPLLIERQQQMLSGTHPRLSWQRDVTNLPALPLFFIANEFFDALPIQQFVGDMERTIGLHNEEFVFLPESGPIRETCEIGSAIIHQLAMHIAAHNGAGLVIDYGYGQGEMGDTLQAMRSHTYSNPLKTPGEVDLTAHVDFQALRKAAQAAGVITHGPISQGDFLRALGAEVRALALCHANPKQQEMILSGLERLIAPEQMGVLFKVLMVNA